LEIERFGKHARATPRLQFSWLGMDGRLIFVHRTTALKLLAQENVHAFADLCARKIKPFLILVKAKETFKESNTLPTGALAGEQHVLVEIGRLAAADFQMRASLLSRRAYCVRGHSIGEGAES